MLKSNALDVTINLTGDSLLKILMTTNTGLKVVIVDHIVFLHGLYGMVKNVFV